MVYDRKSGATRSLAETFDRHVDSFAWSPDSKTLYFTAEDAGRAPVYAVPAAGGAVKELVGGATFGDVQAAADGRTLVVTRAAFTHPPEIYRVGVDGSNPAPITRVNDSPGGFGAGAERVSYRRRGQTCSLDREAPDFDPRASTLSCTIQGAARGVDDSWSILERGLFAAAGYWRSCRTARVAGSAEVMTTQRDWGPGIRNHGGRLRGALP